MRVSAMLFAALAAVGSACGPQEPVADASERPAADVSTEPAADVSTDGGFSAEGEVARILVPGAYAFSGTSFNVAPTDLAPLDEWLTGAEIVGLGEAAHASGGFYAFKARYIRHLVETQGVRAIAMETNRGPARTLDAYLQSACTGSAKSAIEAAEIEPSFADDNLLTLVNWLCRFNSQHTADPVHFYGIDTKQPEFDLKEMKRFIERLAEPSVTALFNALGDCKKTVDESYSADGRPIYDETHYFSCNGSEQNLWSAEINNRQAWVTKTSEKEVDTFVAALRSFISWQDQVFYRERNLKRSYEARDSGMYNMLYHQRSYAGRPRTVVWAHNYHLTQAHAAVTGDYAPGAATLGSLLRSEYGQKYQAVALLAWRAEVHYESQTLNAQLNALKPSSASFEAKLKQLGEPYVLADLKSFSPASVKQETGNEAGFKGGSMVPADQFRAAVFMEHSPPMNALFW